MRVEARVIGRKGLVVDPRDVQVHDKIIRLRDLISIVVADEVERFNARQSEQRLVRVLTPDEINLEVLSGKVDSGGRELTGPVEVGPATKVALEAYADGFYFVFVDAQQIDDLDSPIEMRSDSKVRFLRLVPLAGG